MLLTEIEETAGRTCYEHVRDLFADAEIPIADRLVAQGDLICVRQNSVGDTFDSIAGAGVDVIAPADGGHAHTLIAPDGGGTVRLHTDNDANNLILATVETVKPVYLLHAEHGAIGLAAGRWEIRGQREYSAAEARRVAD